MTLSKKTTKPQKGWKFLLAMDGPRYPYGKGSPVKLLPRGERPGPWTKEYKRVVMCQCGWHYFKTLPLLRYWISQMWDYSHIRVFRVEVRGVQRHHRNKSVAGQLRFLYEVNPKTGRRISTKGSR